MELLTHQRIVLERLRVRESSLWISQRDIRIHSRVGIFSNPHGSGKTWTLLMLILQTMHETHDPTIWIQSSTYPIVVYRHKPLLKVTMIICSEYHVSQWIKEIKQTSLSYLVWTQPKRRRSRSQQSTRRYTQEELESYSILLCTPSQFGNWLKEYSHFCILRFIYEEPMDSPIRSLENVSYRFLWIVTTRPYHLLLHGPRSFLSSLLHSIHSFEMFQQLIITNTTDEINQSYSLFPIEKYSYYHYPNILIHHYLQKHSNLSNAVFRYFNSIMDYQRHHHSREINIEQECLVCLESSSPPSSRILLSCCHSFYCLNCILQWLQVQTTCPQCRKSVLTHELNKITSICNEETPPMRQMIIHKDDIIFSLLHTLKNEKWLIVLSLPQDQSFLHKLNEQTPKKYPYKVIIRHLTPSMITHSAILILNQNRKWIGFNMQCITTVVFYNTVSIYQHDMVVHLVNRIGRKNPLKFFYF